MNTVLESLEFSGTRLKEIITFYRNGVWTAEQAIGEMQAYMKVAPKSDVAVAMFWALQLSID